MCSTRGFLEVFYYKNVFKNFPKFKGKQLCRSLIINEVAALGPATLLKIDSDAGVFV